VQLAEDEARKALELEPDNATAHATLAWVFFYQADFASALEEADVALKLNPNDAQAHLIKGRMLVFAGRMVEGRTSLAAAARLDPFGPTGPPMMVHNVISYYFEGDYSGAETMARRAIRAYPNHPIAYRWLAAALGQLGRAQEGRAVLDKIMRTWPESFDIHTRVRLPWFQPKDYEHMLDGLRKAGWQG
jgi:adenylate cyclase